MSSIMQDTGDNLSMAKFSVRLVPLSSVGCRKPLRALDADGKRGLMHSIGEKGLLKPIVVRQDGERFEVLDGIHRWQACLSLGWMEIPAIVIEDVGEEVEALLVAIEMALVKRPFSPIDKARCMQQWLAAGELRQVDVAMRLGVSETKVSNVLSLLKLPKALQELVHSGLLAETAAYELVRCHTSEELEGIALEVLSGGLTNKQVVAKLTGKAKRKATPRRRVIRCGYLLHLEGGRAVAMEVPMCASIEDLKACLSDALAEIEARQEQGAMLADFAVEERNSKQGKDADGGSERAA